MPATYEPIATTTLGSAANTITFSSIPATYTDLKIVWFGIQSTSQFRFRFNNDTATNYSYNVLQGDGTSASSSRFATQSFIYASTSAAATYGAFMSIDVMSYAGSTNKTALVTTSRDLNGSGSVDRGIGLWRSTAAINRVDLYLGSGNMNAGATATLYGIKSA